MTKNLLTNIVLLFSVFLARIAPSLFSKSMFLDGAFYAVVSRNLSIGSGEMWAPHYTNVLDNKFYSHPPLMFWLQSLWFKVFGDSIFVERFYSLFCYLIIGYIIVLFWKEITNSYKFSWFPLLLWIAIDDIAWACSNNMLENTMTVFSTLSAWVVYKGLKTKKAVYFLAGGLFLAAAVLTKGFVCLYVWSLPFFYWLFIRKDNFLSMTMQSAILILSTVIPFAFLFVFSSEAAFFMEKYIEVQLLSGLQKIQTVNSRFSIIIEFLEVSIPVILILLGAIFYARNRVDIKTEMKRRGGLFLTFMALTLSGVLPIMISMKQSGFYILSVFPFFALGVGYYILPVVESWVGLISINTRIKSYTTVVLFIGAIGFSIYSSRLWGRDEIKLKDTFAIIDFVGEDIDINISDTVYRDWGLHAYFARYGNVSLDPRLNKGEKDYFLITKDETLTNPQNYILAELELSNYKLYIKKD